MIVLSLPLEAVAKLVNPPPTRDAHMGVVAEGAFMKKKKKCLEQEGRGKSVTTKSSHRDGGVGARTQG
jgi:hypothetical protein